ncbi:MAG: hypothetical protein CMI60_20850 [Parvibaculum sp.]|jgi:hypothetical protein|nr:hypothetical protein [Parvibaculum sp.]|tara:strand:+ start:36 stop:524 length:489 start_codon:yes stop_codon:yes gene_type:complete
MIRALVLAALCLLLAIPREATAYSEYDGTLSKRIRTAGLALIEDNPTMGFQTWFAIATTIVEASDPARDLQSDIDDGKFSPIAIGYGIGGNTPNVVCEGGGNAWNTTKVRISFGDVFFGGSHEDYHEALRVYAAKYNAHVFARDDVPPHRIKGCKVEKTSFD